MGSDTVRTLLRERFDRNLGILLRQYDVDGKIQYAVVNKKPDSKNDSAFEMPIYAHICITDRCNLSCPYCYANDLNSRNGNMSKDSVLGLLEILNAVNIFAITWTGGEPFCHPSIQTFVEKAYSYSIPQTILTNGTCIPDEFIKNGPHKFMLYQFSLNNAYSFSTYDIQCHNAIYNNIRICNAEKIDNILTIILEPQDINSIDQLIRELIENDIHKVRFGYYMPVGQKPLNFNNYFHSLSRSIPDYITVRNLYRDQIDIYYQFDSLSGINPFIPSRFSMCEAGTTLLYIDNDGESYPCPLFKSDSSFRCGNIFNSSIEEIWNAEPMNSLRNIRACPNCSDLCKGWCRAIKYFSEKTIYGVGTACRKKLEIN